MNPSPPFIVADRLALILDGLCRAVAARIASGAMAAAVILLVWQRVRRVEGRILGLLERFRTGRIWVRVASRPGVGGLRRGDSLPARMNSLPRGFGWLLPLVPSEAACFAGQLRAVLAEPEMVGLLAASPQAGRVLAPLCRMLGIEAGALAPDTMARPEAGSPLDPATEVPTLPAARKATRRDTAGPADPGFAWVAPVRIVASPADG